MTESKRRRANDLPPRLHIKKEWFYYVLRVKGGRKWLALKTQDIYVALQRWAQLEKLREERAFKTAQSKLVSDKPKFRIVADKYLDEVSAFKSPRSYKDEQRYMKFLVAQFGPQPIDCLTRMEILAYLDSLRTTPYEANHRLSLLRHLLRKALDWGYIDSNPAIGISKYNEKRHVLKLTTDILFGKIYPAACVNLRKAIMLAFHLAQHEKEVKGIKWEDINLLERSIRVYREKTKKELLIFMNDALYSFLLTHASQSNASDHVIRHFDKKTKKYISYASFKSLWKKALVAAGLKKGAYKFKEIRHLANTCMKNAGIIADKRSAVTGHSSISSNEIYTHACAEDTKEATQAIRKHIPDKF